MNIADRIEQTNITENLISTVNQCAEYLNLGTDGASYHSELLTNLIKTAQRCIENYLWYDLNNKTYIAYFNLSSLSENDEFKLKKAPIFNISDIVKIEYLNSSNVWTEITKGNEILEGQIYQNINIKKDLIGHTIIKIKADYVLSDEEDVYNFRITFKTGYSLTANSSTFTVTIASPAVVTINNHGLKTGDNVMLSTMGSLPTGLLPNVNYWVIHINANTFNLALSLENALMNVKINTSGTQNGVHSLANQNNPVPDDLKNAIKETVAFNYLNRSENFVIPDSVKVKIDSYSIAKTVVC